MRLLPGGVDGGVLGWGGLGSPPQPEGNQAGDAHQTRPTRPTAQTGGRAATTPTLTLDAPRSEGLDCSEGVNGSAWREPAVRLAQVGRHGCADSTQPGHDLLDPPPVGRRYPPRSDCSQGGVLRLLHLTGGE